MKVVAFLLDHPKIQAYMYTCAGKQSLIEDYA